jgi:cytochrome P450
VISEAILMLAMHPEVQQKVVDEIKCVFGSSDAPIDYESLNECKYLDFVVKETMRLFPVLPASAREATEDIEAGELMQLSSNQIFQRFSIISAGKIIPKGATVVISAFSVQRNKKYWGEDADKFQPERFEPENFAKIPPYAYIPFTGKFTSIAIKPNFQSSNLPGGPRICIGWRYGMLFVKSCLVNFLRNYKASTSLKFEELDYEITISMKIIQRCMISIEKRDF